MGGSEDHRENTPSSFLAHTELGAYENHQTEL
jgi:hypothetical protein